MIKIEKRKDLKQKPDFDNLGFGKFFTDHMFVMNYDEGQGWHDPRVVPYENFSFDPATTVFHYAQEIFEGLKAFKNGEEIVLFRPEANFERMNNSCRRMCIPELDTAVCLEGLKELVKLEKDWIPAAEGTSLYIRPTIVGTDHYLGVKTSKSYIFYIILSPVAAYYAHGLEPVRIYVEEHYARTAAGGTGEAKCGGNYAASLIAGEEAKKHGFDQVLWLDSKEKTYVEEVGSMNIFFVIDGTVVTPALNGSILPGITRRSVIQLLKDAGIPVEERQISMQEIMKAADEGKLDESFGTGTAAVISPVGVLHYQGRDVVINDNKIGKVAKLMYDTVVGIQKQRIPDKYGWVVKVD